MNAMLQSYRGFKGTGGLYTPDLFTENVGVVALFKALSSKSIFSRGLPEISEMKYLQQPAMAKILLEVLRCGKKTVVDPIPYSNEAMDPALTTCIKNGWLYSKPSGPIITAVQGNIETNEHGEGYRFLRYNQ